MTEHKIAVVGPGGVGKTALTLHFVHHFNEANPVDAPNHFQKIIVDGKEAFLDMQDTSAVEHCTLGLRECIVAVGQGFVLVYSTTSKDSFDEIKRFKDHICRVKDLDHVPMVLVGNKFDLGPQRAVTTEEGAALAKSWNVPFFETSALQGLAVDEVFSELVRQIRAEPNLLIPANKINKSGKTSSSNCTIL